MKRRSFLKKSAFASGAIVAAPSLNAGPAPTTDKDFYELKVYHLNGGAGRNQLQKYYTEAVIPFLKKRGAKVLVFNEFSMEEPPVMYILHAHKSLSDYYDTTLAMRTDPEFLEAAKEYTQVPVNSPVYARFETFLMEAFDGFPRLSEPGQKGGLLEMRIYESYCEDAGIRKVKMFNDGEIQLFNNLGFHPLLFSQHLAGQYMPALTYMLWFNDMEERDALWAKFGPSPEWREMSRKEEYANTVSKIHKKFLVPVDFS
ncbi:NIPSNAP family protein [uncultured Draconibacterium sp.]|uniref:NIPSNAP family protein n=1 Tax=uncultured Draconibacterium sp. TaxID=1573823 RepID=UPI0029BFFCBB|nr:NIPSNAP family protein [uncultured Draconibacterium sp.]